MKMHFREGWSSLVFLLFMLLAVAWSLDAAQWADGMSLVPWVALLGLLLGVLSARSTLPGWFSHLAALFHSIFWMGFFAGTLLPGSLTWYERIEELRGRYWLWLGNAFRGNTNTDNLIFLMEVLLVLFLISYAAAWCAYRRHSTWQAILPAGAILVLNIYNARGEHTAYLLLYLFAALLFAVRVRLAAQEGNWQAARVGYSRLAGFDFLRDGFVFSAFVILLAQALPVAAANPQVEEAIQKLEGPWQGVRDRWNILFASLNYKPEPVGTGFFGPALTLGGAISLNSTPMMEGRAPKARYWTAVVYDKYNSRGWENSDAVAIPMRVPEKALVEVGYTALEPVTQTVKVFYPTSQLFGIPQPVAWNRPVIAQVNRDPKVSAPSTAAPLALSMANSAIPTRANDEYTVLSMVSKADNKALRKAGTDYPDWVKERYLGLPKDFPPRIRTLADRVVRVANAENDFDRATALETYLRQFTYNEYIPAPPPDRDVVDYFLFTGRQGYCNYYASAMATMLRSLGIPARIASGYSRGEYDSDRDVYLLRESDSHTWVEVFFPNYGWIEFEPTASQPLLERIEGVDSPDDSAGNSDAESGAGPQRPFDKDEWLDELEAMRGAGAGGSVLPDIVVPLSGIGYVGVLGVLLALSAAGFGFLSWRRHLATLTPLEAEYESLQRYATWTGLAPHAAQTPHEFAAGLAAHMPQSAALFLRFAELYVRSLFARGGLAAGQQQEAQALWVPIRRSFFAHAINRALTAVVRAPERARRP